MTKKNVLPVVVLTAICVVVAAVLAVANMLTAPVIEEAEREAVSKSLEAVMEGEFEKEEREGAPESVTAIYREKSGRGYVVTVERQGYASTIAITVGIDTEGRVTKAVITKQAETHGRSGIDEYVGSFSGLGASELDGVDMVSNATVSSTAIRNAIKDALAALGYGEAAGGEYKPEEPTLRSAEELAAAARELAPDFGALEDVTPSNAPATLKRLYKSKSGKGYAAYIITGTQYVSVATEGLVTFDAHGKITGVKLFTWTVGHGVNYTEEFLEGFVGKTAAELGAAELVSGATGTSSDFRDAVRSAAEALPSRGRVRTVAIVALVISVCGFTTVLILKRRKMR